MDHKTLQNQLKNCKIRQGPLYKRSKFLKEWRERWIVLTMNYLFTFTNKTCKEVTDIIDLKQMKSYKSYLRKDDEMIPAGFKIRSDDNQFYFCGKNSNEKWSWIVTIERLMDYKYAGSSTYNNIQFIKTRGFASQVEFENGGKVQKGFSPQNESINLKTPEQAQKQVDNQVQKIMKQLQNQKQQLKAKQLQFNQRQRLLLEQQVALKNQQSQKIQQLTKKLSQTASEVKQVKKIEEKVDQKKVFVEKAVIQQRVSLPAGGTKVSQMKNIYQQKIAQTNKQTTPNYRMTYAPQQTNQNIKKKSKNQELSSLRARTVVNLFEQFHQQNPQPLALKYILDFLVKMASHSKYGYYPSIVSEAKSHKNRKLLAQAFIELFTDYKDLQNCDVICKFIQICVFQAPEFFTENHIPIIKRKLIDFLLVIEDQAKTEVILKGMFIVNKIQKYDKNQNVKNKLSKLINSSKLEENKNWARKLIEQF